MHQSATPTSLETAIRDVDAAIGLYGALRRAMFKELMLIPKGWRVGFVRDPAKGIPGLPVKWTREVTTEFAIGGLQLEAGIATIEKPETYAPFYDFKLLDPAGNRPAEGSETAHVEMRLSLTLERLLNTARTLAGGLPFIVRQAAVMSLRADTTALSRLAHALPVFPYWTTLKDMSQAGCDKIIADEKPLLDDASFALHLLVEESERVATVSATPPAVSESESIDEGETRKDGLDIAAELPHWKGELARWKAELSQSHRDAEESTRELKAAIKRWVPEWDGRRIPWKKVFAILVRRCNVRPADFASLTPPQVVALLNDSADSANLETVDKATNGVGLTNPAFSKFCEAVGRSAAFAGLKAHGLDLDLLSKGDRELMEKWLDCAYELAQAEGGYREAGGLQAADEETHWVRRNVAKNALAIATSELIARAQQVGVEESTLTHLDDVRRLLTGAAAENAERFLPRVVAKLATYESLGTRGNGVAARPKVSKREANIKAREFLSKNPNYTSRELATRIGCSTGLVSQLPAWRAVKEERDKGRQPKKSAVVRFTPKMEQVVGVEDETLTKLINEQEADAEPSPLVDDAADDRAGAPRQGKIYRKP